MCNDFTKRKCRVLSYALTLNWLNVAPLIGGWLFLSFIMSCDNNNESLPSPSMKTWPIYLHFSVVVLLTMIVCYQLMVDMLRFICFIRRCDAPPLPLCCGWFWPIPHK